MDRQAFNALKKIQDQIAAVWREGTTEVLKRHNPELLQKIDSAEKQVDSLVSIDGKSKTKELRKRTKEALMEYKRVCLCASMFATRYLDAAPAAQ